jgi:hypothetical protein
MSKNYLYGDIEVKCTGRYVNKPNSVVRSVDHFIEITPIDDDVSWTKFVNVRELHLIQFSADLEAHTGELKRIESPND